jgi:hypothetical protein
MLSGAMKYNDHLILQTVAETDRALSNWADFVGRDQFFELGRDPDVLRRMEEELDQLNRRVGELGKQMKFGRTPMQQALCYFAVRGELQKTAALLRDIRRRNQGSVRQTALFLSQAEACRATLHEWAALLQRSSATRLQ